MLILSNIYIQVVQQTLLELANLLVFSIIIISLTEMKVTSGQFQGKITC